MQEINPVRFSHQFTTSGWNVGQERFLFNVTVTLSSLWAVQHTHARYNIAMVCWISASSTIQNASDLRFKDVKLHFCHVHLFINQLRQWEYIAALNFMTLIEYCGSHGLKFTVLAPMSRESWLDLQIWCQTWRWKNHLCLILLSIRFLAKPASREVSAQRAYWVFHFLWSIPNEILVLDQ